MDLRQGSESQDSDEPAPPGITKLEFRALSLKLPKDETKGVVKNPLISTAPTAKGVEQAKKRLRAFSIQKKSPLTVPVAKPIISGNNTVVIGKLSGVKVAPKVEKADDEPKKVKPPKPGSSKKYLQESYTEVRKKTLSEIEDMKRKMELVELGIPLGLICPTTNEKAMPTKAMPPIKSFLDPAKVDDLIREAKKARAEGKAFKFDYQKILPGYDNPFQRKKDETQDTPDKNEKKPPKEDRYKEKDRRKEKYERRYEPKGREREKYRERDTSERSKGEGSRERRNDRSVDKPDLKETDVNLSDYYVCDSWSLDTEDKSSNSSPKVDDKIPIADIPLPKEDVPKEKTDEFKKSMLKKKEIDSQIHHNVSEEFKEEVYKAKVEIKKEQAKTESPRPKKVERLHPVIDSFKFEIDENDDEVLDIFDEDIDLHKFSKKKSTSEAIQFDYERDISKDNDTLIDDTFLESVINEIKQENMSDDESQDKALVEYDMSPVKEEDLSKDTSRDSVTPELDERFQNLSSRSDLSDGYKSTESSKSISSYRSTESGYKSTESYKEDGRRSQSARISEEREGQSFAPSTMDCLDTWSFVLKICQPLLFRHDRDKCYKQTQSAPPVWWCACPRRCSCVRGRSAVLAALGADRPNLVAHLYTGDQMPEASLLSSRSWYPPATPSDPPIAPEPVDPPPRVGSGIDDGCLDREYQKFMEAVWPEVTEAKPETPPSSTPVKRESRKKKKDEDKEDKKKAKKMKLSSDGWSQESDVEEDAEKICSKKQKEKPKEKSRKRKMSASTLSTDSDSESHSKKKKKKNSKKKESKKAKSKAKRKKINKKMLKKLKAKKKKKKPETESEFEEELRETKKKDKKSKKIKQKQLKKKSEKKKKKAKSSSSSSSSSDSSSESDSDIKAKKKKEESKKKKKGKKKKRKQSTSESTQSEELFDVNILNNIKKERVTDDERQCMEQFSPRRQKGKHREIINVKELQEDFSSTVMTVQVKQEAIEEVKRDSTEAAKPQIETEEKKEIEDTNLIEDKKEIEDEEKTNIEQCKTEPKPPLPCDPPTPKPRPPIEKDDPPSRPSSVNNKYSFSEAARDESFGEGLDSAQEHTMSPDNTYQKPEEGYELYEQMAMAYQSDVASNKQSCTEESSGSQRIETVVRSRSVPPAGAGVTGRGEIKCDWRATDGPAPQGQHRPSRWGLKPGDVNIVLTGGAEPYAPVPPPAPAPAPVYQIQSIANRTDTAGSGYDEAYMDMYGASDRLQYGDCFSSPLPVPTHGDPRLAAPGNNIFIPPGINVPRAPGISIPRPGTKGQALKPVGPDRVKGDPRIERSSLDDRITRVLKETVLGEVARDQEDKGGRERGILVTKSLSVEAGRGAKRVSFADGYKPGQDSDVEDPPKKRPRRRGCMWPCSAPHPDHVPLWDALPPPPPPPGDPPTLCHQGRFDPITAPMQNFMPPEPPPGILTF